MRFIKLWPLFIIVPLALVVCLNAANDPNTPVRPPAPEAEHISRVDNNTIWITTTQAVKKKDLLRQEQRLEKEIETSRAKLRIVRTRLAAFE